MKISSLLKPEAIAIGGSAFSKDDAISKLVDLMTTQGNVADRDAYEAAVHAREDEGTTALGESIAIPHAKTAAVTAPGLVAMTLPAGVDYDAPDGQPTTLMFLIAAPDTKADVHLCRGHRRGRRAAQAPQLARVSHIRTAGEAPFGAPPFFMPKGTGSSGMPVPRCQRNPSPLARLTPVYSNAESHGGGGAHTWTRTSALPRPARPRLARAWPMPPR